MKTREMLQTHPASTPIDEDVLLECIEACYECAQTCTACADACLAEDTDMQLTACIRTNLDCADICEATGRVLTRLARPAPALLRAQVSACMEACKVCAEECRRHAEEHEHCRVCAESCEDCQERCAAVLNALSKMQTV